MGVCHEIGENVSRRLKKTRTHSMLFHKPFMLSLSKRERFYENTALNVGADLRAAMLLTWKLPFGGRWTHERLPGSCYDSIFIRSGEHKTIGHGPLLS